MTNYRRHIILSVQMAAISVFFGRAYQHLYWDAPFRALFWDENLMSGLVSVFSDFTWREYVTSPQIDSNIQSAIFISGIFYLLCGVIAIFIKKLPTGLGKILWIGSTSLIFLAFLYMKEKFLHLGQFFEYTLQFLAPIFLYYLVHRKDWHPQFWLVVKVATFMTFTCHGLYAIGYYPRPESFMTMTMNILGTGNESAVFLLKIMGSLDFVAAIGIFLNFRFSKWAWIYTIIWGFATAIARVWSNFYLDFWQESLHQWTFETVMRFPHFLIPLAGFLYFYSKYSKCEAKF